VPLDAVAGRSRRAERVAEGVGARGLAHDVVADVGHGGGARGEGEEGVEARDPVGLRGRDVEPLGEVPEGPRGDVPEALLNGVEAREQTVPFGAGRAEADGVGPAGAERRVDAGALIVRGRRANRSEVHVCE
jgi:hypothetical protein